MSKLPRGIIALLAAAASISCVHLPAARMPLVTHRYQGPQSDGKTLFLLLPGQGDEGSAYQHHGFIDTLFRQDPTVDAVAVDAHPC